MGQEVEKEVEMRMRRADREQGSYTERLHSSQTNMQVSDTFQCGDNIDICQRTISVDS